MSVILEGRDIKKSIGENEILKGISIQISAGDFMSIVGASGSGKSSLMYILGLLDSPTSGDVIIDGRKLDFRDAKLLSGIRNKKIGFVFQFHYLITELTAYENVLIPMLKNGFKDGDSAKERSYALLESLGLKGKEDRKPYQLSGGEQQRVAIARALANDPEIVMADEPTGNLDSKNSAMVMDVFLGLNEKGRSILMITHEMELAKETKSVLEIKDGLIVV
ncbi:MAG TPA: ABC transporter ATP-binding protein [Thermodesulfobacteriota bacterium]|nr:ABC transporter ATP-binding protein [Thermodesulfobacteriota bacterium]